MKLKAVLFVVGLIFLLVLIRTHQLAYSIGYELGSADESMKMPTEPQMINLVNIERERVGISKLKENGLLDLSARNKACDMQNKKYFTHNTLEGKEPWFFISDTGYNYKLAGENMTNILNPSDAIKALMDSPKHRENILNPDYKEIGIGMCGTYLVQHFGAK